MSFSVGSYILVYRFILLFKLIQQRHCEANHCFSKYQSNKVIFECFRGHNKDTQSTIEPGGNAVVASQASLAVVHVNRSQIL